MNLYKTKILYDKVTNNLKLKGKIIENVHQYTYLGHLTKLRKESQQVEVTRRVRMASTATKRLKIILKSQDLPMNLISEVFKI